MFGCTFGFHSRYSIQEPVCCLKKLPKWPPKLVGSHILQNVITESDLFDTVLVSILVLKARLYLIMISVKLSVHQTVFIVLSTYLLHKRNCNI